MVYKWSMVNIIYKVFGKNMMKGKRNRKKTKQNKNNKGKCEDIRKNVQ